MKIASRALTLVLTFGLFLAPATPTFAQLETPPVTPPPVDVCPNIDGVQTSIPGGMILDGSGNCVTPLPADTTAPVISAVVDISVSSVAQTITWVTDELSVSTFEYGTSQSYGSSASISASLLIGGTAVLTGLSPSTTYYYCIHATDASGNTANSCGHSFTTAAPAPLPSDVTAPDITLVTVAPIAQTSATVTWTTNEVASAQVEYGTTAGYGSASPLESNLALTHSVVLSDLTANTTYHYRVKSSDSAGNEAVGPDETFTTSAASGGGNVQAAAAAPPVISEVEVTSLSASGATIIWTTDLPSDSQVEYGVNSSFGSVTAPDTALATMHSVTISGLNGNTNYLFRVKSKATGAVTTISDNYEFNTLAQSTPQSTPAVISSVAASPLSTAATVTWATDKAATTFLEYGITTAYGLNGMLGSSLATSHTESLNSLEPSTTYHYRVISVDGDGNTSVSEDHTFTTSAPVSGPVLPPAAVALTVAEHGDAYGVLSWDVSSALVDTAETYDIRYSTSPITGQNFAQATKAQEPVIGYEDLQPNGTSRTYTVVGLNPSTLYYFAVKAKYQASDWSALSNTPSVTTLGASVVTNAASQSGSSTGGGDGGSGSGSVTVAGVTGVTAEGNDGQITLNWKNPASASYVRTIIIEKEGSYPASPADGELVYEGRGETFTDIKPAGSGATTDYFAIYTFDKEGRYSAPVRVAQSSQPGSTQTSTAAKRYVETMTQYSFPDALEPGDIGMQVQHLQQILAAHADLYPKRLITGYFGSYTKAAIQKFQQQQGLPQTGVADEKTIALLNSLPLAPTTVTLGTLSSAFDADLRYGMMSDDVEALQRFLIQQGLYPEAIISEYFGPLTRAAVIKFQQKYNITPVQGYVGPKTRTQIKSILGQ